MNSLGDCSVILEIGIGATFINDEKDKYCLRGFIKIETSI
jgi:hypothetical protein